MHKVKPKKGHYFNRIFEVKYLLEWTYKYAWTLPEKNQIRTSLYDKLKEARTEDKFYEFNFLGSDGFDFLT